MNERKDLSIKEALSRADKKALVAQLLDRGLVNARLEVKDADPNFYYMWVRENDVDIDRAKSLEFEIVTEEGKGLHGTGDNRRRIGDVVLMRTPMENYEIIQEVKRELKAKKMALGKREYLRKARFQGGAPPLDPLGVGIEED